MVFKHYLIGAVIGGAAMYAALSLAGSKPNNQQYVDGLLDIQAKFERSQDELNGLVRSIDSHSVLLPSRNEPYRRSVSSTKRAFGSLGDVIESERAKYMPADRNE